MIAVISSLEGSVVAFGLWALAGYCYWTRLFEEEGFAAQQRFLVWAGKGLVAPLLIWTGFNSGVIPWLPPLMPGVVPPKAGWGQWISSLPAVISPSLLVISSFWAVVTFGWLIAAISTHAARRRDLVFPVVFWAITASPVAWLILRFGGLEALGIALMAWLLPAVHFSLPLTEKTKPIPAYAPAIAKMKFGKYGDAECRLLQELEKCEDDFEGWLMLADLYANHFNELAEADRTIRELCRQPNITGVQVSTALHRLADWHLKVGDDPAGARRALAEIGHQLPGTHFARMAQQRLQQLPASPEELREQRQARTIRLPALNESLSDAADGRPAETHRDEAAAQANQWVEKLRQNPNNVAARETLAMILAERLDQVEAAIGQLELLIGMPGQPPPKIAEWLSLMAAWHIKYRQNWDAARQFLERLIHEFPQSPQAFAAQRRLNLMEMELRLRKARS